MDDKKNDLRERTTEFALRIVQLYKSLPKSTEAQVLGKQVLRSGTSVGAQFRESQRAKSDPDFINKLEGVLQEADETAFWLELLVRAGIVPAQRLALKRNGRDHRHPCDHRNQSKETHWQIMSYGAKNLNPSIWFFHTSFFRIHNFAGDLQCLTTNYSNSKKKNIPPTSPRRCSSAS
jgi:four helix bundle protein